MPIRLFVDMDGTLAAFEQLPSLTPLYERGYFLTLPPMQTVIEALTFFLSGTRKTELYILSSVLPDAPYASVEKNMWLDRHLPWLAACLT